MEENNDIKIIVDYIKYCEQNFYDVTELVFCKNKVPEEKLPNLFDCTKMFKKCDISDISSLFKNIDKITEPQALAVIEDFKENISKKAMVEFIQFRKELNK